MGAGGRSVSVGAASQLLAELREFASFTSAEQRYIRRSLETASVRAAAAGHWARGVEEAASIGCQARIYVKLAQVRSSIPDGIEPAESAALLPPLIAISAFDLAQGKLTSFAAYRFLYERLIGATVRPWLASAFCAAAVLPCIHPELRAELLLSLSCEDIGAAGWSSREPQFIPEWVEKVPVAAD
jgi:hypothetical protein